jgi:hypothetical protein
VLNFLMVLIQTCTQFRFTKTLPNTVMLGFISATIVVGWQMYRKYVDEQYSLFGNVGVMAVWALSAVLMAKQIETLPKT